MADDGIDIDNIPDEGDGDDENNEELFDDADDFTDDSGNKNLRYNVIDYRQAYDSMKNTEKQTMPLLTKFEKAKIIGLRATQISQGAEPLISVPSYMTSSVDIAEEELKQHKIPMIIRRYLPNNRFEDWRLDELIY